MERTIPEAPELVAPVQGAPVRGGAAKLVWKPVEGATGYHVQAAADEAFARRIVDTRLGDVTSLVVQRILHGQEGAVYWRVAAIGAGGTGAFSEPAEFISSPAPAEEPHAGLTAESGAETAGQAARHDPSEVRRHGHATGRAEFGVLVAALILTAIGIGIAFIAFPGLSRTPGAQPDQQQNVADSLRRQQQQQAASLQRYQADSTGYAIPIDSAISRMARPAGGETTPFAPPASGE